MSRYYSTLGQKFAAEVLTTKELNRLIGSFGTTYSERRNRLLVTVYARVGLRCQEALDLYVKDVNFDDSSITVLSGKGGKRRVVGVDEKTLNQIVDWVGLENLDEDVLLFASIEGKKLSTAYVRQFIKRNGKKARITKRVHVHGLRHTAAYMMAKEGIPLAIIQRQLGHSSISTTYRYINHLTAHDVVDVIKKRKW